MLEKLTGLPTVPQIISDKELTNMTDVSTLLDLPTDTLVVLGGGYIAYRIASTGLDQKHKTTDVVFLSLAYGLIAKLGWMLSAPYGVIAQVVCAFIGTILAASIWRKWLSETWFEILRKLGVSHSDRLDTAWDRIKASTKVKPGQLVVRKTDGSALMCDNLFCFKDFPHGPCIYGADGSIAMYVTHYRDAQTIDWVDANPVDKEFGASLTYITSSQIAEIETRN